MSDIGVRGWIAIPTTFDFKLLPLLFAHIIHLSRSPLVFFFVYWHGEGKVGEGRGGGGGRGRGRGGGVGRGEGEG